MKDNDKTYAIIKAIDIEKIDFTQIQETSSKTILLSLDNSKFVIKWQDGYEPTFISRKEVKPLQVLSHAECLELIASSEWSQPIEEIIKK